MLLLHSGILWPIGGGPLDSYVLPLLFKGADVLQLPRFIKDGRFHVSEVYLENENRNAALVMIMVLCLVVYSITEYQFRNTLATKNTTIRDQYKKPTKKPSAKS